MRFLIDNNLSPRLVAFLQNSFPESTHVADHGLTRTSDQEIWRFCEKRSFHIITKDNDFEGMSRLYGCPPKVVQLICGNRSTLAIMNILDAHSKELTEFLEDSETCLLYIG